MLQLHLWGAKCFKCITWTLEEILWDLVKRIRYFPWIFVSDHLSCCMHYLCSVTNMLSAVTRDATCMNRRISGMLSMRKCLAEFHFWIWIVVFWLFRMQYEQCYPYMQCYYTYSSAFHDDSIIASWWSQLPMVIMKTWLSWKYWCKSSMFGWIILWVKFSPSPLEIHVHILNINSKSADTCHCDNLKFSWRTYGKRSDLMDSECWIEYSYPQYLVIKADSFWRCSWR